jgi:hypothetical protein
MPTFRNQWGNALYIAERHMTTTTFKASYEDICYKILPFRLNVEKRKKARLTICRKQKNPKKLRQEAQHI